MWEPVKDTKQRIIYLKQLQNWIIALYFYMENGDRTAASILLICVATGFVGEWLMLCYVMDC